MRYILIIFLFILSVTIVVAQPGGDPGPPIPIDGGLIYLILGGLAIGIKKLIDKRKSL